MLSRLKACTDVGRRIQTDYFSKTNSFLVCLDFLFTRLVVVIYHCANPKRSFFDRNTIFFLKQQKKMQQIIFSPQRQATNYENINKHKQECTHRQHQWSFPSNIHLNCNQKNIGNGCNF